MSSPSYFQMMARYHARANDAIYDACAQLTDEERRKDLGAFFGSIHNTLNHVLIGGQCWMDRFEGQPAADIPLNGILADDFDGLNRIRKLDDERIQAFADRMTQEEVDSAFLWQSVSGYRGRVDNRWIVYAQLFNHATHHRGQVHTMLTQLGYEAPAVDVQAILVDEITIS